MTPSSAGYGAGDNFIFRVELRYGISLIPGAAILLLFLINNRITFLINRFPDISSTLNKINLKLQQESKAIPSIVWLGIFNLFGTIIIIIQLFFYQHPSGLPGFNHILFVPNNPPSIVYKWIQQNLTNQVIYSIGLCPYGVYGFPYSNIVIYNLGSANWTYSKGKEIINQFHPQFIFISRDPFSVNFPEDIKFLVTQPTLFKLIYQDQLVLGFQIINPAKIKSKKL